jgi:transposase
MRVTTLLNRMIALDGLWVKDARWEGENLVVQIRPRRRLLTCSECGTRVRGRFHERTRRWRHLGTWGCPVWLEGPICRLRCPTCQAVRTEAVAWARPGSAFTRTFEDAVAVLAQKLNHTEVAELTGVAWATVGNIAERIVVEELDPDRLEGLRRIGVDEISYRKHHRYLTVVVDHDRGRVVWVGEGKSSETLKEFFTELGPERSAAVELVSLDMSRAFIKAVEEAAPQAVLVFDHFHVARLANAAVDAIRRQEVAKLEPADRPAVKGSRWALLKRPERLKPSQAVQLSWIKRANRALYRGYLLKESFLNALRSPTSEEGEREIRAWLAWASRSRLKPFVKLGRTVRRHLDGILAIMDSQLTNARLEGMNNKIRLLSHRAYGFHSPAPLIATIYLCCSGITLPELHLF